MPQTLGTARGDLRARLNEATAAFWTDAQLNSYLNEGCRNIARKAKCLQEKQSIPVAAGNQTYGAPQNIYELHRAEYLPTGSANTYALEIRNYSEMDSIWGSTPQIEQYNPGYLTLWREPPNLNLVLFPVPSSAGVMNVFYFRVATAALGDGTNLDCPEGWWDLVVLYATYKALFQALDARWKEARDEFNQELMTLVDQAQGYSDAAGLVSTPGTYGPLWAFGGGGMDWY